MTNGGATAALLLEKGGLFLGRGFGAAKASGGELVFNTAMAGYQELLTDKSYRRQIVVLTPSHVGNTGVNREDVEAERVEVAGLVVRELCDVPSNWRSVGTLSDYLAQYAVPGIAGVDTRRLVQLLREEGAQRSVLFPVAPGEDAERKGRALLADVPSMEGLDLVSEVSTKQPFWFAEKGERTAIVYDFGRKEHILRMVAAEGFRVRVVPFDYPAAEVLRDKADAVVLTNGPGDPAVVQRTPEELARLVGRVPMLAVCMGHQLLARALGASTYKLKFGHHGVNHPVRDAATGRVLITSQNHGFAVEPRELPKDAVVRFKSLYDGCCEGFASESGRYLSAQFHPEAKPGPTDADLLFQEFFRGVR